MIHTAKDRLAVLVAGTEAVFTEARDILVSTALLDTAPISIRTSTAYTFADGVVHVYGLWLSVPEALLPTGLIIVITAA